MISDSLIKSSCSDFIVVIEIFFFLLLNDLLLFPSRNSLLIVSKILQQSFSKIIVIKFQFQKKSRYCYLILTTLSIFHLKTRSLLKQLIHYYFVKYSKFYINFLELNFIDNFKNSFHYSSTLFSNQFKKFFQVVIIIFSITTRVTIMIYL